jgi:drug/metabolite transporter (DMT)-like permease
MPTTMKLDVGVVALVLLAALLHASWNAVVKSDRDRLVSLSIVMLSGAVMGLALAPFVPFPDRAAWPYLFASIVIHYGYYFSLLRAYAHGDLSHVYPIARGLGPLLVAALSGRLVGEHLNLQELGGVMLVSAGIGSLALAYGLPRGAEWRPTLYAIGTGVTIAGYTIADGLGVRGAGNSLGYIVWLNILEGPGLLAIAFWRRGFKIVHHLRQYWLRSAAGGVVASLGYGIAIWAMGQGGIAHVAALRETSVLFAAMMGSFLLKEPFGGRRIAAAALVVAGLLAMNFTIGRS